MRPCRRTPTRPAARTATPVSPPIPPPARAATCRWRTLWPRRCSAPCRPPTRSSCGCGPRQPRPRRSRRCAPDGWTPEAYPAPAPPPSESGAAPRRGLSAASVPRILLGLGALCLLAAAVIFLAVAWSWLGVGGRTAVLVSLTLATGALGTRLGGRGLRVAAESLTAVALGLLALDVVGADNAGWLGEVGDSGLACAVGAALLLASLGLLLVPAPLVVPQVVSAIGLAVLVVGATGQTAHDQVVAALAVLAFAGLAFVGRLREVGVLPWAALAGGAFWWSTLALDGFAGALEHQTVTGLWVDGHGWAMLASAALVLLPAAFLRRESTARGRLRGGRSAHRHPRGHPARAGRGGHRAHAGVPRCPGAVDGRRRGHADPVGAHPGRAARARGPAGVAGLGGAGPRGRRTGRRPRRALHPGRRGPASGAGRVRPPRAPGAVAPRALAGLRGPATRAARRSSGCWSRSRGRPPRSG